MTYTHFRRAVALAESGRLPQIGASTHLVLLGMAVNATGRDPCYSLGWEHLARGWLGYSIYDDAAQAAVGRAVRNLTDRGLVLAVGWVAPEGHRVYELYLS